MKKSEPTFVPEWLKSTAGTVSGGGGNSAHHLASSSFHSDVSSVMHQGRQRNYTNISDFDSPGPCHAFLDRTSSFNSRRSYSNGSAKHAYSSFSRSHRDNQERDKERSSFVNHWDRDSSDPLDSILTSRVEKLDVSTSRVEMDTLRRSHSMVSRKQGEALPRRVAVGSGYSGNIKHNNGNDLLSGGAIGKSIHKAGFEKDFPSLGTEERQVVPQIASVSSPGLSSSVGNSALIGGEGWTSALAEMPAGVGSSCSGSMPAPLTASTYGSGGPSVTIGLNMAEALVQAPSRTRTAPQLSVNIQRREELAIKQSKQLIPVTPAMPKGSVLSSVDKSKAKPAVRASEMNIAAKGGLQQPSLIHHGNQSTHGGHVKSDMPKASGKLLVLKPGWENEVSSHSQKDVVTPTNCNSKVTTSQHAAAAVTSAPARKSNNSKHSAGEHKADAVNPIANFIVEKRSSLAQTQSRNDFFNLLKKKTSTNTSVVLSYSNPHISSSTTEKSEVLKEVDSPSSTSQANENGSAATSNGGTCQEAQRFPEDGEKNMKSFALFYPDEEEAAFLRSLGWEENSGDDEGLTEEEINAFYKEYMKLRPSLKPHHSVLPRLAQSIATNLDGASSALSSSDSCSEA
ncbi:cell wall protein AWA1-like isoform X2 [Hibiscus syriacus]|uniref:Cell wall protein AWA1-like isoform X2 n=1 Tax=Hibiscus syriacus TaxID=106335 RepID=A0A6A2YV87_HIBSY|nr:uncharacterized protein LOC120156011 [Hibiscus syriacus]XP_039023370.1 uncharacterized protein LOC120156011 [Hibiscus syriacus]XP_039023371.1 uncharacterized protein LOC120156011 [Hibiscus syriacus]KAE8683293.1 cell wall protein AWA1-like isoform X2 [Hibiscus syriacus]